MERRTRTSGVTSRIDRTTPIGGDRCRCGALVRRCRAWGQCLLRLKRFDEAEGRLLACYDNFPAAEDAWDGESRKVLDELVRLYEAWKKPDRAAEFKKLLERPAPNRPTDR